MLMVTYKCVSDISLISARGDFPGGPVVKVPCFHCRRHGFNPWLGY